MLAITIPDEVFTAHFSILVGIAPVERVFRRFLASCLIVGMAKAFLLASVLSQHYHGRRPLS